MADSGTSRELTLFMVLTVFLAVLTVVVGNGGQQIAIAVVGVVVLVVSLLALTGGYVISTRRTFWLVVTVSLVVLIGYGLLHPAAPPVGVPPGR